MFARSIARVFASSTAPLRVQVHLRERDFLEIRGGSRQCSACDVLELHRLVDIRVPLSVCLVHATHVLVLPLDVLQLGVAFISTRP